MPATLPELFGRYRIVRKLGEGGMGVVYLADDMPLRRPVALKIPHFSGGENPKLIERFQREARLAAQIVHPNLCPIYDVGLIDGVPYLAMAYIEGKPFTQLLNPDRPWSVRRALEVVRELALLMQVLHERNIIHRDLKPGNIMVRPDGSLVLMDFGLARALDSRSQPLTGAMLVGTPSYMAPEQVEGNSAAHSPQSDIYALGVILFELLTGRCPFQGPTMQLLAQVLHARPPVPSTLRPELDAQLDQLCLWTLAKNPHDRPTSMQEFAAALTNYLTSERGVPLEAIRVVCPGCGRPVKIPPQHQGKQLFCPRCKTILGTGVAPALAATLPSALLDPPLVELAPTLERSQQRTSVHPTPRRGRRWVWVAALLVVVGCAAVWATKSSWWDRLGGTDTPPEPRLDVMSNSIGMKFVKIPAGTFMMGAMPDEAVNNKDERPRHEVEITQAFYLSVYEVTQGEYETLIGVNPSYFSALRGGVDKVRGLDTKRHPVEQVAWDQAVAFCVRLSELPAEKQQGRSYRLPTEAEWEYACRAGQSDAVFHFGSELDYTMANFNSGKSYQGKQPAADIGKDTLLRPAPGLTYPVGSYNKPNRWGLYDMHGNVKEWCQDFYQDVYYMVTSKKDPLCVEETKGKPPGGAKQRVHRGGGWESSAEACRSAVRYGLSGSTTNRAIGFRVVCVVGTKPSERPKDR